MATILVIDDEESIRNLLTEVLERAHHHVLVDGWSNARLIEDVLGHYFTGQLEPRPVSGQAHEDVRRVVADRHPPQDLEAELLVEGDGRRVALDVMQPHVLDVAPDLLIIGGGIAGAMSALLLQVQ